MHTWLTYENRSLNQHIGRIGLFWDISSDLPDMTPVLWRVIEQCRFNWHHPLCIDWEPTFLLCDQWGNQRAIDTGTFDPETGTRIDGPFGHGLNSQFILTHQSRRSDLSFVICRNKRPLAHMPLSTTGSWSLTMPGTVVMQLDCPVKLSSRIIDPKGTGFSLNGLKSLKVALRGGAPGAGSTPLSLVSYGVVAA
jgi:hypothetical protein